MNGSALFFLAGFALAARGADRDVERVFPVTPGCRLQVELFSGAITVTESDVAQVRVEAHCEINSDVEDVAARLLAGLKFTATADGNTVKVGGSDPSGRGVRLTLGNEPSLSLSCEITVPRQCDVELRTLEGAITVGNLAGRIVVRTGRGNIFVRRVEGSVEARARAGDVIISRCTGPVVARTENGLIRVGTVGGRADLQSAQGDIEVLAALGGIDATADAGDVTAGFPRNFSGDARIKTAYGNIVAKIDPAAHCEVRASSFWGRVQAKVPLTIASGGDGDSKLSGRLNGGGPTITLSADGGRVSIMPGETLLN